MPRDPETDPFVLLGYGGCSMRCEAHAQPDGTYTSTLKVREGDPSHGRTLFDSTFEMPFGNAGAALNWAILRGQQIVARYLENREREHLKSEGERRKAKG